MTSSPDIVPGSLFRERGEDMKRSFYHFALQYRGKVNPDDYSRFADAMFLDHAFPKATEDFEKLSRYIEEKAHPIMRASIFDAIWEEYEKL